MNSTLIHDALAKHAPVLASDYKSKMRYWFKHMTSHLGPELKGVTSSWQFARTFNATIRPYLDRYPDGTQPVALVEAKLDAGAERYGKEAAQTWAHKILSKLGDLDTVDVPSLHGNTFLVKGTRAGHTVLLEQSMIINVSPKGKVFNQFPARLYLDGKLVAERAYKAFWAAGPSATEGRT